MPTVSPRGEEYNAKCIKNAMFLLNVILEIHMHVFRLNGLFYDIKNSILNTLIRINLF